MLKYRGNVTTSKCCPRNRYSEVTQMQRHQTFYCLLLHEALIERSYWHSTLGIFKWLPATRGIVWFTVCPHPCFTVWDSPTIGISRWLQHFKAVMVTQPQVYLRADTVCRRFRDQGPIEHGLYDAIFAFEKQRWQIPSQEASIMIVILPPPRELKRLVEWKISFQFVVHAYLDLKNLKPK